MKKLLTALFTLVLVLGGCGTNAETFIYTVRAPIETMDTVDASYSQTFDLLTDIFLGAKKINADGELIDGGAKSVEISDDNLTYTINLRDDVKWVDNTGTEVGTVTANDYVTAYQRIVDPNEASVYSYIFEPVKNATKISAGEEDIANLGVVAIDDYTLQIELEKATPYFESMLAFGSFMPVASEAVEQYGNDYGTSAETTWYNGAYYVSEYDPNYVIALEKNPSYITADDVELERIEYRLNEDSNARYNAFLNDEVNYAEITTAEDYTDGIDKGIMSDQLTGYSFYMVLNQSEDAVTSNANLRKGLAYGFDRAYINEASTGEINEPIEYIIPSGMTGGAYDGVEYRDYSEDSLITYDKEKANQYFDAYMEEMGYTDRSEIKINFLASADASGNNKAAEAVQSFYLQEFGITVDTTIQPFEQFVESRRAGGFDALIQGWGPDYADPSTYLALWQTSQIGSQNYANYANPEYDELFEKANSETDIDKRFEQFAQLEKLLVEDNVLVPFYQKNEPYVLTEGYTLPQHLFFTISHEYITKN